MLDTTGDLALVQDELTQPDLQNIDSHDDNLNTNHDEDQYAETGDSSPLQSPQDYPINTTDLIHSSSGSDDEYFISDDEDLSRILSHDLENARLPGSRNMADHVKFFTDTISQALDSADIDKSLVLEAQISGNLNNENQKIIEKKELLLEKLKNLQILFGKNFGVTEESKQSRVDKMRSDITNIEQRIARLKNGSKSKSTIPFIKRKQRLGVVPKFPIEYNQAKDKVLERQFNNTDYNDDNQEDDDYDDDNDLIF